MYQFQIEPIFLTILLFCGVATHLMCDRICSYDFAAKSLLILSYGIISQYLANFLAEA